MQTAHLVQIAEIKAFHLKDDESTQLADHEKSNDQDHYTDDVSALKGIPLFSLVLFLFGGRFFGFIRFCHSDPPLQAAEPLPLGNLGSLRRSLCELSTLLQLLTLLRLTLLWLQIKYFYREP